MNKKILHYIRDILAAVMLCSVFLLPSYADDQLKEEYSDQKEIILEKAQDTTKTIGELKNNIEELKDDQENIEDKLQTLKDSTQLGEFFKDNMTDTEIEIVTQTISSYKVINSNLNKQILEAAENFKPTTTLKQDLLEERKQLYISLVPYIKIEKLDEYLEYIKGDANYLIEKKELSEDIVRKEEVINEKVEKIEEKIEENKKNIEAQLQKIIGDKIDEYLNKITQNEKFIELSYEAKINVINSLMERLHEKIVELKASPSATSTMIQKIDILEKVFIEKLEEFKAELIK